MYANIKGSTIPQPIEAVPTSVAMIQEVSVPVKACNKKYYDSYFIISSLNSKNDKNWQLIKNAIIKKDGFEDVIPNVRKLFGKKVADSLYLNLSSDTQSKVTIKHSDSLREAAKDIDFIITVLNTGEFQIGNITLPFAVSEEDKNKFGIANNQEKLIFYNKAILALESLGYYGDITISQLKESDWKNLNILIKAFADQQPVPHLKSTLDPIQTMNIQGHKFLLVLERTENDEETYQIWDFFKTELIFSYQDENGHHQRLSQTIRILQADGVVFPGFSFCDRCVSLLKTKLLKNLDGSISVL